MKVKTFEQGQAEKLDEQINEFEETHNVKATQYKPIIIEGMILYTAMVFFIPEPVDNTPQATKVEV